MPGAVYIAFNFHNKVNIIIINIPILKVMKERLINDLPKMTP